MKKKHIAVLMGGWNAEREVSLASGNAAYNALIELGYPASKIDFGRDIVAVLEQIKPDIIFNALHGTFGEDGRIQGLLDILNIPYTHSGVLASAVCMDKILAGRICSAIGVKIPRFALIKKGENQKNKKIIFEEIGAPFVIKPINQGSSVGIIVILENMDFDLDQISWEFGDSMMVEQYIAGQEIQVAVLGDKALGAIEVRPKNLFYDYQCKYTAGMTQYIMPAEITTEKYNELLELAYKCHKELGCKDISRIDFILHNKNNLNNDDNNDDNKSADNNFYLLEANTHPGFTPTSLVPKIAKYCGISFNEIVEYLVNNAKN